MEFYTEPEHKLPVTDHADVIVAGAGPAGYTAAIAAARTGAKTILVEQFNCVGGMATSGMMSHFTGCTDSPVFEEMMARVQAEKAGIFCPTQGAGRHQINHEILKKVLFDMLAEAGVILKLYTFVCGVVKEGDTVRGIITESKSGRAAIMGKVVIDATGDGDVAAKAGAEYQLGREEDGKCQPVTLMFRIGGVDYSRAILPGSFETRVQVPKGEIQALAKEHLPSPAGHTLLYPTWIPGEVCVNMTNVTDIDGTSAADLTKAEQICRRQMSDIILFLREYAPGYENCYLVTSAQMMGVRETRHFKGLYTITPEDIVEARVFDDWIATRNMFNFDIHNVEGSGLDKNGAQHKFQSRGQYTIPYRACVPVKIDGLLLAGRDISGTHKAHSNYRVMPICMNIGQGIGVAAAIAARDGVQPRDVDVAKVQAMLKANGVEI